jgi:hypothetical protein
MPVRNDITKSRVLRVINDYNPKDGYITFSDIAKELFCDWATARKHVGKYEETRNAYLSKCEMAIDEAEKTLFQMSKSDVSALKYLLSTKGKHRGYGLPSVINNQVQNDYFGMESETKVIQQNGRLLTLTEETVNAIEQLLQSNLGEDITENTEIKSI